MNKSLSDKLEKIFEDISSSEFPDFVPGETFIPTGLAVYGKNEALAILESLSSKKLGLSNKGHQFERKFAEYCETDFCVLTNSGSSASLLALEGVKEGWGLEGGEIITPACGFPTTVNPMIQLGFDPVFVDVDESYNLNPEIIKEAITEQTKGIFFAHTLGNPAKIEEISQIAKDNGLFLIEDCCDAYGATYAGKKCGSFGDVSTASFYPAHNITLAGEGGAIMTKDGKTNKIIRSLRDWGRDCHCDAGQDNSCSNRFGYNLGDIPYDHKYIFSRIGYNLKPTELQAAMGLKQMERLESFNESRKENFKEMFEFFSNFEEYFSLPKINPGADPVFFGFPLMIKENKLERKDIVNYLNNKKIGTRYLFGGNLLLQPAYKDKGFKKVGNLERTNKIAKNLFWIGTHPGINADSRKYIESAFREYLEKK